jgi:hypothetical protein
MKRLVLAVLVSVIAAAGCSSSDSPEISTKASKALAADVQVVRVAASKKSNSGLVKAINTLRAEVSTLESAGEITTSRAANIDNAAGALLTDHQAMYPPPTPTPTPSLTPTPTPSLTPTPTPTVTVTVTPTPTPTPTTPTPTPSGPATP